MYKYHYTLDEVAMTFRYVIYDLETFEVHHVYSELNSDSINSLAAVDQDLILVSGSELDRIYDDLKFPEDWDVYRKKIEDDSEE